MDVNIDHPRINLNIQYGKGKAPFGDLGLIGMLDGFADHQIADTAPVDQNGLPAPIALQQRRFPDKAFYRHIRKNTVKPNGQQFPGDLFPVKGGNGIFQIPQSGGN